LRIPRHSRCCDTNSPINPLGILQVVEIGEGCKIHLFGRHPAPGGESLDEMDAKLPALEEYYRLTRARELRQKVARLECQDRSKTPRFSGVIFPT
jgi:hypothetical protein